MASSPAIADSSSFDSANYDPIDHLNILFGHASTVSSLPAVSRRLRAHSDELSASVAAMEAAQAYGSGSSLDRMQSAQAELASVFARVEDVRSRAVQTEQDITTMTADIKRLDGTKRNLTVSMTALKRLQMLTTAYEQLQGLAHTRQYRDCAGLLQAVLQLMRHFSSYRSIEQIAVLSRGVTELQRELLEQVCEDFEMAFVKDEVAARRNTLIEACLVMDALGDMARARLVTWYVNTELREYRQVFRGNDEAGSLDNIGRRYAWFRRMLKTYEEEHAALFPVHWRVHESLTTAFCDGTRDDFRGILERSSSSGGGGSGGGAGGSSSGHRLDVNLLLRCLQETLDFEQGLDRRFAQSERERELPRASMDTLGSASDERAQSSFNGSISVAFEPYLSLWVESQDKQLATLIPQYRSQPLVAADEEFSPEGVAPSALELFHVYKLTLSQCAKLSTGERLLDLSRILAKYLDEYAQSVLLPFLQDGNGGSGQSGGAALHDIILVMNTADFWNRNTTQLEESLKKRIDAEFVDRVDLSAQADAFLGVAGSAVQTLVRKVEVDCDAAWREMRNTNWSRMDAVTDHSAYVTELTKHMNERAQAVLAVVAKTQYARAFCDHLVEYVATTYIHNIVQCRPVSEIAAEQMLLDKYTLTKWLEKLLSLQSSAAAAGMSSHAAASFVKRVGSTMGRVDPLLKTLQVQPSPPEGLVQAYLIHIADRSDTNFRKILDLKGVRKQDQPYLMELFAIHRDSPSASGRQLAQSSTLLTPLMNPTGLGGASGGGLGSIHGPGGGSTSGTSAGGGLQGLSLGEKLLNAARDGVAAGTVSGLGISGIGGGGNTHNSSNGNGSTINNFLSGSGGAASAGGQGAGGGTPAGQATINENLKNIGKFFRRDIGGLGARFGKRDVTPTGTRDEGR